MGEGRMEFVTAVSFTAERAWAALPITAIEGASVLAIEKQGSV